MGDGTLVEGPFLVTGELVLESVLQPQLCILLCLKFPLKAASPFFEFLVKTFSAK